MRIQVNGETRDIEEGTTVTRLLQQLALADGPVAVERNHEIVPRTEQATTALCEGDVLEVVQFVGGG